MIIPIPSVPREGVDYLNPTIDRILALLPTEPTQVLDPFYGRISIWSPVCLGIYRRSF